MVGLVCYAYGLRDLGFSILNIVGCCCSIDQIRKHGSFWAKKRSTSAELINTGTKFWRVSFDNLNYKIKYAKKLCSSGVNKMLNLITAQVCCRQTTSINTASVAGLAQLCTRALMPSVRQLPVTSDMFTIALLDPVLSVYIQSVYKVVHSRLANMSENKMCLPVMNELRKFLPHYTPLKSDIIVYTSVEEARSANKDDVTGYLTKLKEALKIGSPDFPNCIILCGDQQTYSIIVQLKKSHPTMFSWYYPLPGDWHLMKLTSEVIRDIIWDGGLKQFCSECGIKPVPQCSHTHSPYCLILQPNLPQCLSCCLTCFGWSYPPGGLGVVFEDSFFQRYIAPINQVGGRGVGGQAKRAIG